MTQVVRICKYGCNTELGPFDTKQNKYLETNGTLHTKQRCESLKQQKVVNDWANEKQETNGHNNGNDLSLEVVLKKLKSIGITLDLTVLRNAVNGDTSK